MHNISPRQESIEFGQVIEYNKRNISLQKSSRKWDREISFRPFVFLKSFIWGKSNWFAAYFQYISIASACHALKTLNKTFDHWSREMVNFEFLEKYLAIISPPYFEYDFSKKCFSCYILLTDQISLHDCLSFLRYWPICVLQLFVNQVMMS